MTRSSAILVAVGLVLAGPTARAQGFSAEPPRGEIGLRLASTRGARQDGGVTQLSLQEWVKLTLDGAIVGREWVTYSLQLQPSWAQGRTIGAERDGDRNDVVLGFAAGVDILPRGLVTATLNASRTLASGKTSGGVETDLHATQLGGRFAFRNRLFPVEVSYQQSDRDELRVSGPQEGFRTDYFLQSLRLVGGNRKTRINLSRNISHDRVRDRRFVKDQGELQHRAWWGKGSRLASSLRLFRNADGLVTSGLSWGEHAYLQHTQAVASDVGFNLGTSRANGTRTRSRLAQWGVSYRILDNLNAGSRFRHRTVDRNGSSRRTLTLTQRAAFHVNLPLRSVLSASGSFGYERFLVDAADGAFVTVIDELHVVEPSRSFVLDNTSVDPGSVFVTDPLGQIVFESGLDYQTTESGPLLEIIALPTGRIAVGDTLLVSYMYEASAEAKGKAALASYSAVLSFPWFHVTHRRNLREAIDGADAMFPLEVGSRDEIMVGVGTHLDLPVGLLDAQAEWEHREYEGFTAEVLSLGGNLSFGLPASARASVGGSISEAHVTTGEQTTASFRSSLGWTPVRRLSVSAMFATWRWARDDGFRRRINTGSFQADWRVGLTRVHFRYTRSSWDDGTAGKNDRIWFHLIRTF